MISGRVATLIVALLCCSVLAQVNEHVDFAAEPLVLSSVSPTWANPSLHSEQLATTVGNVIPGGDCVQNVHPVTNINQQEGSYFSVIITPELGRSLSVITSDGNDFNIIEFSGGSATGTVGSCTGSSTCEFFYYCDDYSTVSSATVRVFSSKAETTDSSITYDLQFRQFTESIQDMTSRTFTQATGVASPFDTTNPGPQNFVQYYHDLDATLAEESASGRLFVEVSGFNSATGTAYVCVSNSGLVAYNGPLGSIAVGSDNVDTDPINNIDSFVSTPAGCPATCNSDNLAGGDDSVIVAFDACTASSNCGLDQDLYIGVIPPGSGSTYTVTVHFRSFSVPSVVQITSAVFTADGELTDSTGFCDGTLGDFSCDNYYELVNAGSFVTADPARGPFVRADIFGVYDGTVSAFLTDGNLAGTESLCSGCSIVDSCTTVCSDGSCDRVECYLMAYPCDWNSQLTNEWVVTVSGDSQNDSQDFIEYGIEVEVGEFPLDTVLPNIDSFSLGSVLPRSYHHYQVTFTADDIFDDSLFAVELYSNSEQEDVRLMWRYNSVADDGTCLGYDGLCNTNDSPDGSFCRFEFLCCPIASTYSSYITRQGYTDNSYGGDFGSFYGYDDDDFDYTSIPDDFNLSDNGLKVAELRAGTYYFAVQGGVKQDLVFRESIDYTLSWTFTRSVPIYDGVTSLHHVYNGDYSPQYFIDIPDDETIERIEVRISDVINGEVTAYLNCGALAGDCPCWEAQDQCSAIERALGNAINYGGPAQDCVLRADPCTCAGQRLYVSVQGTLNGQEVIDSLSYVGEYFRSEDHSIGYSITPVIHRVNPDEYRTIEASRDVTTVTGSIAKFSNYYNYYNIDYEYYFPADTSSQFRFFAVDLTNVELSGRDSLAVRVAGITQQPDYVFPSSDDYYDLDVLDVTVAQYLDATDSVFFTSCEDSASEYCFAILNQPYYLSPSGDHSGSCEVVLQPCRFDPGCFDSDTLNLEQRTAAFNGEQYYITIENTAPIYGVFGGFGYIDLDDSDGDQVHFTLSTQVLDQTPVALQEDVPVAAFVRGKSYQHFSFDVASAPANSRLVAEFYAHQDQDFVIDYYMNFVPSAEEPVLAGETGDCYANLFSCDQCRTTVEDPFCAYEISPCELSGQSGTYYLSARLATGSFFDSYAEFTVKVHFVETVEILTGGTNGLVEAGNVLSGQTAFYSVTVPSLTDASNNIIGRIINIDVEVPTLNSYSQASIFVTITQDQPDDFCNCIDAGHQVLEDDDDINWSRYSCELVGGEVYYISVQGGQDSDDFDQMSFVVHAKIRNVIEVPVALTSSLDTRVIGEYSNLDYTSNEFGIVVDHDQFIAFSFAVNPVEGSTLNFEIFQDPQGSIPTNIEVDITRDTFYSPSGTNDGSDVGPSPSRSGCPISLQSCSGALGAGNECQLSIAPCALSAGTYYITISGESLPLGVSSQAINVHVVLTTPGTLNVPTGGSTVGTTSISFTNDIFGSYGVGYFNTASLGIPAADELEFAYSGSAVSMSVTYGSETNADGSCGSSCSDFGGSPACDVIACNTVNANTWFVGIDSGGANSGTFTITSFTGPAGDLTLANTLTIGGGVQSFAALGNDEWRYHAYTVPADTSSHYELNGSVSPNDIFYVGNNDVFRPNLVVNGVDEVAMQSDGSVGTVCTAFSTGFYDEATCCYPATTEVFAVVGNVGAYTLQLDFVDFLDGVTSLSAPGSTGSQSIINSQVDWWRVNVPAGQHIYFDFEVTVGDGELYLNRGQQAGSNSATFDPSAGGDFGSCWDNSGLVDAILVSSCTVGEDCNGFLPACDACLNTDFSTTFTFAVVPTGNTYYEDLTYSLTVVTQVDETPLSSSNTFTYPSNNLMIDDRQSNDPDAIYQFYSYDFSSAKATLPFWIPVEDDNDILDDLDYPHVRFTFDNVRDSLNAPVTNQFPLDIFISASPFAGNPAAGCYGGRDITSSAGVFPCIEGGSGQAFNNNTLIECSVSICDLGCPDTVYFAVSRSTSDNSEEFYTFDVEVVEEFDFLQDDFEFVSASVGTTPVFTDFETSYVFIDLSSSFNEFESAGAPQVLEILFDNIDDNLGSATTLVIESVPQFSCTVEASVSTDCTISSTGTTSCELIYDPCTTQDALSVIEELVFRVRRTSGSAIEYGFDVTATLIDVAPFDSTINNVDVGSPYQHTKEIFDGEWQFFEFEVIPNNNYYWMTFDIQAVCCADVTDNLEVYYSWVSSGSDVIDVTRPKRWPSDNCDVDSVDLSLNGADSNDILDFCVFNGGVFRVSIFAQPGLQLFPEFPVTYSIDVQVLETVPVVVPLECVDVRSATGSWNGYYEIHVEAENRGTELSISLGLASTEGADVTLHASTGAQPFTRGTNSQCAWGTPDTEPLTDEVTDYYCVVEAGSTSCTIDVPPCEFSAGIYYLFVEGSVAGNVISISSHIDRKYIPVASLSSAAPVVSWDGMVASFYQYYRVNANDAAADFLLQATASATSCDDCDYTMYLIDGEVGFAAGANVNGDERSPHGNQCGSNFANCFDSQCSFSSGSSCELQACTLSNDVAFIGIVSDDDNKLCKYNLEVSVAASVASLPVDELTCSTVVGTAEHWVITNDAGTALDFSESTLEIQIQVSDDADGDLEVYIGDTRVPGDNCELTSFTCSPGNTCTFDVQCLTGETYLSIYPDNIDTVCSDNSYALLVSQVVASIQTLSIGTTSSATSAFSSTASSTTFVYQSGVLAPYSVNRFSDGSADNDCRTACEDNTPVLTEAISASADFYFSGASGMVLQQVTPTVLSDTSLTAVTFSAGQGETFAHFVINLPNGVHGATVHITDVDHCACDGTLSNLGFHLYGSDIAPPFSQCGPCDDSGDLVEGACASSFADVSFSCDEGSHYISIASCATLTCDVTFNVYVTYDDAAVLAPAGDHDTAFQVISNDHVACNAQTGEFDFYVDATNILSVTVQEPHGGSGYDVDLTVSRVCDEIDSCTAETTNAGDASSCSAGGACRYSCVSAGRYHINVQTSGVDASYGEDLFELQVVNQFQLLSGSTTNTIIGDTRHFYQVANAGGSIQFDLDVSYGPAIEFDVFTGCGSSPSTSYNEYQICAAGVCSVYIPTEALAPATANYFIVITSGGLTSGPSANTQSEKETSYTLSVTQGASNCAAPPSTGFCADPTFEGVNAFAGTNGATVWDYDNVQAKDDEASCRFSELADRCPRPTQECRQWLKIFSCLESFPQCDANGFLQGTCTDVCSQVEAACGTWLLDDPHFEWGCMSGRYVADASASTCHDIPTPAPAPETFPPVQTVTEESVLTPIVVPDFPTIIITLPSEIDGTSNFDTSNDSSDFTSDGEPVDSSTNNASAATYSLLAVVAALCFALF